MRELEVIFHIDGLDKLNLGPAREIIETGMKSELYLVYNYYADKCNAGITDKLNKLFDSRYPTYFKDNNGEEWYELKAYNNFMAEGYQREIVDDINKSDMAKLLNYRVDPEEVHLIGYLKRHPDVTIYFTLEEI